MGDLLSQMGGGGISDWRPFLSSFLSLLFAGSFGVSLCVAEFMGAE